MQHDKEDSKNMDGVDLGLVTKKLKGVGNTSLSLESSPVLTQSSSEDLVTEHHCLKESSRRGSVVSSSSRKRKSTSSQGSPTLGQSGSPSKYSCHQCKNNKAESALKFCHFRGDKRSSMRPCRKKYCVDCLKRKYDGLVPIDVPIDQPWYCPACYGLCTCACCKRSKNVDKIRLVSPESHAMATQPAPVLARVSSQIPTTLASELPVLPSPIRVSQPNSLEPEYVLDLLPRPSRIIPCNSAAKSCWDMLSPCFSPANQKKQKMFISESGYDVGESMIKADPPVLGNCFDSKLLCETTNAFNAFELSSQPLKPPFVDDAYHSHISDGQSCDLYDLGLDACLGLDTDLADFFKTDPFVNSAVA